MIDQRAWFWDLKGFRSSCYCFFLDRKNWRAKSLVKNQRICHEIMRKGTWRTWRYLKSYSNWTWKCEGRLLLENERHYHESTRSIIQRIPSFAFSIWKVLWTWTENHWNFVNPTSRIWFFRKQTNFKNTKDNLN